MEDGAGDQCQIGGQILISALGKMSGTATKTGGKSEGFGYDGRGREGEEGPAYFRVGLWNTKNLKEHCQDHDRMGSVAHHT